MLGNTEDVLIYKRLWTKLLELVVRHIAATKQRYVELFCNRDTVCHVQSIHCVGCEAFGAVQTIGVFTVFLGFISDTVVFPIRILNLFRSGFL